MRHVVDVRSASFSGDGTRVVTLSGDVARLWDAATGAPLGAPMLHRGSAQSASLSADGTRVVTASQDGTARLWDVRWPPGPITAVACALLPEIRAGRREVEVASLTERYGITIRDPICQPPTPPFDPARIDRR